jgi:hypothetical protein
MHSLLGLGSQVTRSVSRMGPSALVSRRSIVVAAIGTLIAGLSLRGRAGSANYVEDWRGHSLGARKIPAGWRPYATPAGRPAYDFQIVEDADRRALHLKSQGDHSTIAKEVTVDLVATPILEWSWRVIMFPEGADLRRKEKSDATGHIFVVWPRAPALLRSRLIGYVWDPALPVNSVVPSQKTGTVTFVVVRSGPEGSPQWHTEQRNVVEDYRRIFGDAGNPGAVAISIDTNDTRSSAEALIGSIFFRSH